jgi:DNA primase
MSTIPQHLVDEVRLASDVVAVVSDYVTLKKSGRNFLGLCPFHPEKTPSFNVNPDKQFFHCFGCGAGGNVFTFVQRQQNISFPESVRLLAKRAGIVIPEPDAEDATVAQEKDALYFVNKLAAEFFQQMLFDNMGRPGREYMHKRGFNDEALKTFGVGYAPNAWEKLTQLARDKSVNLDVMALAGLVNARDSEKGKAGFYDRFRHRVMFPIYNLSGSVVAFGGRRLVDDEDSPKYMNSPETPIYHKGAVLYGLYQGREALKKADRVIVVEGYLDLMRMHLCGFQNAVATSGTALTEQQARLILRYTKNVTLLFDSDTAGQSATLRGADILVENGLSVSVATLSAGDDPDSFLVKNPAATMQQILQNAPPLLDFKILTGATSAKVAPADPVAKRTDQLRSIAETLARVQDGLERQTLVHNMAERLQIDERVLWEEVGRLRRAQYPRARIGRRETEKPAAANGEHWSALSSVDRSYAERCRAAEEDLIRIMILHNEAVPFIFSFMRVDDFHDANARAIAGVYHELMENGVLRLQPDAEMLLQHFTAPRQAEFVSRTLHGYAPPSKTENGESETQVLEVDYRRWSADCMAQLLRLKKEEEVQNLREQLKTREKSGGDVAELMQQFLEYQEQLKRIRPESFLNA